MKRFSFFSLSLLFFVLVPVAGSANSYAQPNQGQSGFQQWKNWMQHHMNGRQWQQGDGHVYQDNNGFFKWMGNGKTKWKFYFDVDFQMQMDAWLKAQQRARQQAQSRANSRVQTNHQQQLNNYYNQQHYNQYYNQYPTPYFTPQPSLPNGYGQPYWQQKPGYYVPQY